MLGELLYPLPSVNCFVNEDLMVYESKNGIPDLSKFSYVSNLASEWVGTISNDDDNLLSELIYWKERDE